MKKLLIFLMCIGLSSCLTVGRIQRNCDKFYRICAVNTVRDTTIVVKDTVTIELPKDTVEFTKYLPCIDGIVNMPPKTVVNGIVTAEAWVINNDLQVKAWINQKQITIVESDTVFLPGAVTEHTITLPPEKYIPNLYKYALRLWGVVLLLGGVFLLFKYKPNILPFKKI